MEFKEKFDYHFVNENLNKAIDKVEKLIKRKIKMKIEAVKMNEILSDDNDIYQTVMIVSSRARQVIDKRYLEQINLDEIEDTDELIQFSKEDFDKEKPITQAFEEFLDKELEWHSDDDKSNDADEK